MLHQISRKAIGVFRIVKELAKRMPVKSVEPVLGSYPKEPLPVFQYVLDVIVAQTLVGSVMYKGTIPRLCLNNKKGQDIGYQKIDEE